MIQAINLQKAYSGTTVLDLPEFRINDGEVFGLVGNNGAGKTTFFSLVLDLIRASRGKILINEIPVAKSEEWKAHTGAYIDESFTIGYLTPDEYFNFIGELREMNENDVSALEKFKINELLKSPNWDSLVARAKVLAEKGIDKDKWEIVEGYGLQK